MKLSKITYVYGEAEIYKDNKEVYYSSGTITNSHLDHYRKFSDDFIFIGRKNLDNKKVFSNVIDSSSTKFYTFDNMNSPKSLLNISAIYNDMEPIILGSNLLVVRLPSILGLVALSIARKNNIETLVEVVGSPFHAYWYHGSMIGKLISIPMYFLNKKAIKKSENAIYVTESYLQSLYPNKNNSVCISDVEIMPINSKEIIRKSKSYDTLEDNIVFGLSGSTEVKYKGHSIALDALSDLNIDVTLRLVGSKQELLCNKQNIKIYNDGYIQSGSDMMDWLDSLDILLIPSLTEGLPRVALEGMSRGLVVISSDAGGLPEIVNPNFVNKRKKSSKSFRILIENALNDKSGLSKNSVENWEQSLKYKPGLSSEKRRLYMEELVKSLQ